MKIAWWRRFVCKYFGFHSYWSTPESIGVLSGNRVYKCACCGQETLFTAHGVFELDENGNIK